MHVLLVSTASLHPWCAFAAFFCAEITMGTCVFCARSISCIHHIHGDVGVQYITLLGTCVWAHMHVCFCLSRLLIGAELIKSVFERMNCALRLSGSGPDRKADAVPFTAAWTLCHSCCVSVKHTTVRFIYFYLFINLFLSSRESLTEPKFNFWLLLQ